MVGNRLVKIPKLSERKDVPKEAHNGHGHFGQDTTWEKLYASYWWPQAYKYVASCEEYQIFANVPKKVSFLENIPAHSYLNDLVWIM